MLSLISIIIMGLAVYRLASLVSDEKGPYRIFSRFRIWSGESTSHDGLRTGSTEFSRGLICLWCVSVWIGVAVSVSYYFYPNITEWLCLPFALSAIAVITDGIA